MGDRNPSDRREPPRRSQDVVRPGMAFRARDPRRRPGERLAVQCHGSGHGFDDRAGPLRVVLELDPSVRRRARSPDQSELRSAAGPAGGGILRVADLLHRGIDDHGRRTRPHRHLPRPGDHVDRGVRIGRHQPEGSQIGRGRPQVLLAGCVLHRLFSLRDSSPIRRDGQHAHFGYRGFYCERKCARRPSRVRYRASHGRIRFQGLRGSVPYVDARCL